MLRDWNINDNSKHYVCDIISDSRITVSLVKAYQAHLEPAI